MKALAQAVVEHWWFIDSNEKELTEAFGDDFMSKYYEDVAATMDSLTAEECQAVKDVARTWLGSYEALPDEWGYTRRKLLTPKIREFFESLINYPTDLEALLAKE